MRARICWFAGALMLLLPSPLFAGSDDIAVIVHPSVKVGALSRTALRPIFQTQSTTLPDGTSARPLNLPEGSAERRGFDAAVLGLDPDRVARYWIDRKIRGGARPPKKIPSAALMVKVVSKTPGAVGYVAVSAVTDGVKVVAKIVDGEVVAP